MQVKVHWIIDGVADIEAETPEEAENKVENELSKFMGKNKRSMGIKKSYSINLFLLQFLAKI